MIANTGVTIRDSWGGGLCPDCEQKMVADDCWKFNIKITWADILNTALTICGGITNMYSRDFLWIIELDDLQIILCTQGPRKGEVQILNIGDPDSSIVRAFMQCLNERIAQPEETEETEEIEEELPF